FTLWPMTAPPGALRSGGPSPCPSRCSRPEEFDSHDKASRYRARGSRPRVYLAARGPVRRSRAPAGQPGRLSRCPLGPRRPHRRRARRAGHAARYEPVLGAVGAAVLRRGVDRLAGTRLEGRCRPRGNRRGGAGQRPSALRPRVRQDRHGDRGRGGQRPLRRRRLARPSRLSRAGRALPRGDRTEVRPPAKPDLRTVERALREGVDWSRDVKPYHERVIGAIRAVDPDNLVIAGSPSWSQDVDLAAADPLAFDNLAYTLHYYAGTHRQELRDKGDAALAAGQTLLITEFGTVEATGDGPIDH